MMPYRRRDEIQGSRLLVVAMVVIVCVFLVAVAT